MTLDKDALSWLPGEMYIKICNKQWPQEAFSSAEPALRVGLTSSYYSYLIG